MDSLRGAGIVVTRPAERGQELCRRIAAEGGRSMAFPTLQIEPLDPPAVTLAAQPVDWMVFTSVAAVEQGLDRLQAHRGKDTRMAAIGDATAAALEQAGCANIVQPTLRQESEGLLELEEFRVVRGLRILLVKGIGGRELLRETLVQRGADVGIAEVYRRVRPDTSSNALLEWWRNDTLDAIVVSSRAGLENLVAMLDAEGRRYLSRTTLVAPTARMIKLAGELGITVEPVIAAGASDEAVMQALRSWWRSIQEQRQQDSE